MKSIIKWLPNILSLSRVAFAPFIVLSAVHNKWQSAFTLLIIGLATDWFDGVLAIKLNAKSDFGAKILEPYCDFILTIGTVGGLVLTQNISWVLAISLATIAIVMHFGSIIIGLRTINSFCAGFMPFYYLTVIFTSTVIYAIKAFSLHALWLIPPVLAIGVIAIKTKNHRLRSWLRGQP